MSDQSDLFSLDRKETDPDRQCSNHLPMHGTADEATVDSRPYVVGSHCSPASFTCAPVHLYLYADDLFIVSRCWDGESNSYLTTFVAPGGAEFIHDLAAAALYIPQVV